MSRWIACAMVLALAGCAARGPTYNEGDHRALKASRARYQQCVGQQVRSGWPGTESVAVLTATTLAACEDQLKPVPVYLTARKFSDEYVGEHLEQLRIGARKAIAAYVERQAAAPAP